MTQDQRTLTIEGLGFAGEGYVRLDEGPLRFISVPHTLPGDRVIVRVGPERRGRAWAQVERWEVRAADHVDPACEAYDRCSGCALRHVSLDWERAWKRDAVREILGRYGPPGSESLPIEIVCAGVRTGHRSRGRFSVSVDEAGLVRMGLRSTALDGHTTDIRGCAAQSPRFRALMASIGAVLDADPASARDIESVEIRLGAPDTAWICVRLCAPLPSPLLAALEALTIDEGAALRVELDGEQVANVGSERLRVRHALGSGPAARTVEVEVSPGSWTHATPDASDALMQWVESRFNEQNHDLMLDLCAATGTATFRLAPQVSRLIAVDEDFQALQSIEETARREGLGQIETRAGRVGVILRKLTRELPADARPTGALINPMRSPLGKGQLRFLPTVGVRHVVYLGPSAVSAAKDAAVLAGLGFEMTRAAAINLHPGTGQTMMAFECVRAGKNEPLAQRSS